MGKLTYVNMKKQLELFMTVEITQAFIREVEVKIQEQKQKT